MIEIAKAESRAGAPRRYVPHCAGTAKSLQFTATPASSPVPGAADDHRPATYVDVDGNTDEQAVYFNDTSINCTALIGTSKDACGHLQVNEARNKRRRKENRCHTEDEIGGAKAQSSTVPQ